MKSTIDNTRHWTSPNWSRRTRGPGKENQRDERRYYFRWTRLTNESRMGSLPYITTGPRGGNGLTFNRLNWKLNPLHTPWRRQMHWFLDPNVTLCLCPKAAAWAPPLKWTLNTVAAWPAGAMNQLTAVAWQDLSSSIGSPTPLTIGILLLRPPVLIFELLHDQFIFFAPIPSLSLTPLTALTPLSTKSLSTFSPLPSPVLS